MLYCAKRKNDVYTKQVFYANTECMKLSVVLSAYRQFYLIWTFLTNFGPFFGPNEPNLASMDNIWTLDVRFMLRAQECVKKWSCLPL